MLTLFYLSFFIVVEASNIKGYYYKTRKWDPTSQTYRYYSKLSKRPSSPPYYYVLYKNGRIYKVYVYKKTPKGLVRAVEVYDQLGRVRVISMYLGTSVTPYRSILISYKGKTRLKKTEKVIEGRELAYYKTYDYYSNGKLKVERRYNILKKPDGNWVFYDKKGRIIKVEEYDNGDLILVRLTRYYPNGNPKVVKSFSDSKPFGKWLYYDTKGRLVKSEEYVDGELVGINKYTYSRNGTKIVKTYNAKGDLVWEKHYRHGKLVRDKKYINGEMVLNRKYIYNGGYVTKVISYTPEGKRVCITYYNKKGFIKKVEYYDPKTGKLIRTEMVRK